LICAHNKLFFNFYNRKARRGQAATKQARSNQPGTQKDKMIDDKINALSAGFFNQWGTFVAINFQNFFLSLVV
jgi:hypothetical protein